MLVGLRNVYLGMSQGVSCSHDAARVLGMVVGVTLALVVPWLRRLGFWCGPGRGLLGWVKEAEA